MMTGQKSEWQEISLDFFLDIVFRRFWDHVGGTEEIILEIQYMPALLCGEPMRRAFIGAGITLDFPYNTRKDNIKSRLLEDGNLEGLRVYEKEHALGFVMTGDKEHPIDSVTICYALKEPYEIFMQNFGVGYNGKQHPVFLWYNVKKNGKIDEVNIKPGPRSRVRVRYLSVSYFMNLMKEYVESGYKNFPPDFTKDDYRV